MVVEERVMNRVRNYLSASAWMIGGTFLVYGGIVLMNELARPPEKEKNADRMAMQVEKQQKPPPPPQAVRKPPPKPRPASNNPPPAPTPGAGAALSGVDFGIPEFGMNDLGSPTKELLGDTSDVVMTDDSVDVAPRPFRRQPLEYPSAAKKQGIEGYVVLSMLISASGRVERVRVLEAEPAGMFEDVAVQGVQSWEFEPAQYQGQQVKVWAKQTIRFNLS